MKESLSDDTTDASVTKAKKLLFEFVGAVVYWSQMVEETLTFHIIVADMLTGRTRTTEDALVKLETIGKNTLGQLVNVWKTMVLPPDLERILIEVRDERNYICHQMFVDDKQRFLCAEGLLELLNLAKSCSERLKLIRFALDELLVEILKRYGISMDSITVIEAEIREKAATRHHNKNSLDS